jgi:hypothetical protein
VTDYKVGLAIVQGPGSDVLAAVTSKALAKVGIVNVFVAEVSYGSILVYATQQLLKTCDGVIALDIINNDQIGAGNGSNSGVLMSALFQVGIKAEKPVIPGIIVQSSLLEAKGVLPNLATDWSKALLAIFNASNDNSFGKTRAPPAATPSPPAPEETNDNNLLDKFRESLKVILSSPSSDSIVFPSLRSPSPALLMLYYSLEEPAVSSDYLVNLRLWTTIIARAST